MDNFPQQQQYVANIMVVDDEESITLFLSALLSSRGYQVTTFNNPAAALHHFDIEFETIDLVISDQTMPGMSGTEMAAQMFILRPKLPFLLCTGYSDAIDKSRAQALGLAGFLHKPYKSNELLAIMQTLLAKTSN